MRNAIAGRPNLRATRSFRMQPRPSSLWRFQRQTSVLTFVALVSCLLGQPAEDFEKAPIRYSATKAHDRVTALQAKLAAGTLKLEGSAKTIVRTLLQELDGIVTSQHHYMLEGYAPYTRLVYWNRYGGQRHPRSL